MSHFDITFSSFGLVLFLRGAESLGSSCCSIACTAAACTKPEWDCCESEVSELFLSPPPLRNSLSSSFPFKATGRGKNLINNLTSLTLDSAFLSTSRGLVEVHLEPKKRKLFLKDVTSNTYFTRRGGFGLFLNFTIVMYYWERRNASQVPKKWFLNLEKKVGCS